MAKQLHIVYATDSRYLFPTQVAAGSAIAHADGRKGDLTVHILDCGIMDNEWLEFECRMRKSLGDDFALMRHKMDMSKFNDFAEWHASKATYARLYIPYILKDVDWCIYADGDTLFTADPFLLEEIWDDSYAMMGHADVFEKDQEFWHVQHGLPWCREERVCAGFALLNLNWFRDNEATEKCLEFIKKFRPPYNDQDALNYVCRGFIGLLPSEWGVFAGMANINTKPGCFHYVDVRPWEMKWSGRIPFNSLQYLWFHSMIKTCGLFPWKCDRSIAFLAYSAIKSHLFGCLYKFLNKMPFLHGRYDGVCNVMWNAQKIKKFQMQ